MESKEKIRVTVALACFAALSLFAAHHYRRWKQRAVNCCSELNGKPQKNFKRVHADNTYTPFQHFRRDEISTTENYMDLHPYEDDIKSLMENPPSLNFLVDKELKKMDASYTWVDTCSQLEMLVDLLSKEHVFSVDTEHHSLRTFLGFTALMQISTQKEDYLLDTIALHDIMGMLQPIFANPSICKVFHGADNDILWLQRDFHIYVVNLFDTAKACEVLSKPQKSLAYLLESYCGIITNKMLQREDWRRRPLSREMVQYARADAHYLLYIAHCLSTELKGLNSDNLSTVSDRLNYLGEASRRSNMICLQLYAKEIEASPGDSAAASIFSRYLNGQEPFNCKSLEKERVRQLCKWRDLMARLHDESLRYVLSDRAIISLAIEDPKTQQDIYHTIMHADRSLDSSNIHSSLPSPSYIVSSHVMDISCLLDEDMSNPDDAFETVIQTHLRSTGTCPLSAYGYIFSPRLSSKLTNRFYKQNGGKPSKQSSRKASRELFVKKFSCKAPVYHNCRIYASDGRLLCYCDRRKLEWYLHRQLAKLIENDPPGIMLLFEPKGRPEDEDNDFYVQSKKNICVGCGEKNHYLRYRIIPSCYRVHFPEHLKSHRSHDIVLVCVDCHEIAHSAAEKYKKQIAEEFGIPLFVKKVVDSGKDQFITGTSEPMVKLEEIGVSPLQLRTAAMALLRHGSRMPSKRREELTAIVKEYFGGREITNEDLETALLLGMSPQERRRLRKKSGVSLKHITRNILDKVDYDNNNQNLGTFVPPVCGNTSEESNCRKSEDRDLSMDIISGIRDTENVEQDLDSKRISMENYQILDVDSNDYEYMEPLDGTGRSISRIGSPKYVQKLSLLGHGPHGRKVVEYLLNEYGEEGIRQFCQRWRLVFVEAVHPRFLPAGWDIMHSGRRDFGDYSVYNPQNKASNVVKD